MLERYAEPLAAWAWTLGAAHPTSFLSHAWAKLLQNHPHDDICGCSVDAVHRENMTRYAEVEQVASVIARDSFRFVVDHVDRSAQPGVPFVLFNPLAWPHNGTVELSLLFDRYNTLADDFRLVDAVGRSIPLQVLGRNEHFDMEVLKANRKREVRVAVAIRGLPACGYRVVYALPGATSAEVEAPVTLLMGGEPGAPRGMENRHVRVELTRTARWICWTRRPDDSSIAWVTSRTPRMRGMNTTIRPPGAVKLSPRSTDRRCLPAPRWTVADDLRGQTGTAVACRVDRGPAKAAANTHQLPGYPRGDLAT